MIKPHDSAELRSALYHRLRWLWPVLARPAVARALRWAGWLILAGWLIFVALILLLRFVVLPQVGNYQPEIELAATKAVGQTVKIGKIEARWQGLNPDLVLDDVKVFDAQGGLAFSLTQVESVLSWHSLWRGRPSLSSLIFEGPVLHVRRETSGRITVAGMAAEGESDPAFAEWVLDQKRIRIRNATIVWEDRLRKAPTLILEDLQFALDNSGRRHRFGLSAAPPSALASRIDVRGEVVGDIGEALDHLSGKVFVELDYADLAGWRSWVDYPVELPSGRGALRVWGDLGEAAGKVTADLALEEVSVRLSSQLPLLNLANMRGRLEGKYKVGEWSVAGKKLEFLTHDGIRMAPTDFQVDWRENAQTAVINGNASASFVDILALRSLAAYLPFDANTRKLLLKHQPQGRIAELRASWGLVGEDLQHYSLKAGFEKMGVLAGGYFPGASGLSGRVDLTEKGGDLVIEAGASSLSFPSIFPEPETVLDSLKAKINWKAGVAGVDIKLDKLEFAGPGAAGSARGNYLYTGHDAGEIDLTAKIDRADAKVIWRYMPYAVNSGAREWIKRGVVAGRGSDAVLTLKGKLKDFPFRDGQTGTFLVTTKVHDGKVDYVAGWPTVQDIDADISFGVGMKLQAQHGSILGAKLSKVSVDIPDFESHEEMLLIKGEAKGPTSEFLRFLDQSPVGDTIDRFTEGMKASGNGELDLALEIPLRRSQDTKMQGVYQFQNNRLELVTGLPALTQVNGQMQLTEKSISAQDITGRIFGGALKVVVKNNGDKVGVVANGSANISEVSKHFAFPLTEHLAGNAAWKADIAIRKRNADFVIDSDLLGVSSPLPAPLTKSATTPLALRVERTAPESGREQYKITLGKVAQGLVMRRQGEWERAVFALGEAEPRLPEKGLAVRVATPGIDADAWQKYLPESASSASSASNQKNTGLTLNVVTLKTPRLHLMGRDFNEVDTSLRPRDGGWQVSLNTSEAAGELFWNGAAEGWLEGKLKRLVIRQANELGQRGDVAVLNTLPGLSLSVDDFYVGQMALGRLELKAKNAQGAWHLDTLSLQNPDGGLKGKAKWVNVGQHQSSLDFELTAIDAGKLLARLGYADALRSGSARLAGGLQWNGPLTGIDYPSLSGQMTVEAEKGQFNKLDPGVGKLLGLISLQSLPRRLTLDFRDIFSEGLAFDSIEGKLSVKKGIMRTVDPLRIKGPAAQIEIQGTSDLKSETQNLQVVVRPELGTMAAAGVALVNPVVGAATLLANAVLQNPLSRIFSYRYQVTGSWSDPQVDKAGDIVLDGKTKLEGESKP